MWTGKLYRIENKKTNKFTKKAIFLYLELKNIYIIDSLFLSKQN